MAARRCDALAGALNEEMGKLDDVRRQHGPDVAAAMQADIDQLDQAAADARQAAERAQADADAMRTVQEWATLRDLGVPGTIPSGNVYFNQTNPDNVNDNDDVPVEANIRGSVG